MGYLLFGQWLKEVKVHSDALLLLLFPNLCALCGRPLIGREQAVCRICVERLMKHPCWPNSAKQTHSPSERSSLPDFVIPVRTGHPGGQAGGRRA
jgi:predicted amidophosphoribosyltransferase